MSNERKPGQFTYPKSMEKEPNAQPANHANGQLYYGNSPELAIPGGERQKVSTGHPYPSLLEGQERDDFEIDELHTNLINSQRPLALKQAWEWIIEDLRKYGATDVEIEQARTGDIAGAEKLRREKRKSSREAKK
jgi:hypothetical protein